MTGVTEVKQTAVIEMGYERGEKLRTGVVFVTVDGQMLFCMGVELGH
jgi:hypothetical protein